MIISGVKALMLMVKNQRWEWSCQNTPEISRWPKLIWHYLFSSQNFRCFFFFFNSFGKVWLRKVNPVPNLEILRSGACQFRDLLKKKKKKRLAKNHILGILKHTFGNCILTLTPLIFSGILPHTSVPVCGHFSPRSSLLFPFRNVLYKSPSTRKCLSSTSLLSRYFCCSPVPFINHPSWKNVYIGCFISSEFILFIPFQSWLCFYRFTENCSP